MQTSAKACAVVGALCCAALALYRVKKRRKRTTRQHEPKWLHVMRRDTDAYQRLAIQEWDDNVYRSAHGWKGVDYVHHADAPAHVADYFVHKEALKPTVVGAVHFSAAAESHKHFCHGGSMTAVMDDIIGWAGFCHDGSCKPWSGYTVQVNTKLSAPVPVGAWLRVEGVVQRRDGRKVWVEAKLTGDDQRVHCSAEGLVLLNR